MRILMPWGREENSIHFLTRNVESDISSNVAGLFAGCLKADGGGSLRVRLRDGSVIGGHKGVPGPIMASGHGLVSKSREYSPVEDSDESEKTFIGTSF